MKHKLAIFISDMFSQTDIVGHIVTSKILKLGMKHRLSIWSFYREGDITGTLSEILPTPVEVTW